jgi:hypothetical protein
MKNYLYRGSRDQINLHPNDYTVVGSSKGTIEGKGPLTPSDRPENRYRSSGHNAGYPWDLQDPNIFENDEFEDLHKALLGREFQTLGDISKMASRMRQSGFEQSQIEEFVLNYLR